MKKEKKELKEFLSSFQGNQFGAADVMRLLSPFDYHLFGQDGSGTSRSREHCIERLSMAQIKHRKDPGVFVSTKQAKISYF